MSALRPMSQPCVRFAGNPLENDEFERLTFASSVGIDAFPQKEAGRDPVEGSPTRPLNTNRSSETSWLNRVCGRAGKHLIHTISIRY